MELTGIILVVAFFVLLLLNVPISISIGVSTLLAMVMSMDIAPATITIAQREQRGNCMLHLSTWHNCPPQQAHPACPPSHAKENPSEYKH